MNWGEEIPPHTHAHTLTHSHKPTLPNTHTLTHTHTHTHTRRYLSATMDPESNVTLADRTAELVRTTDLEPNTTSSPTYSAGVRREEKGREGMRGDDMRLEWEVLEKRREEKRDDEGR